MSHSHQHAAALTRMLPTNSNHQINISVQQKSYDCEMFTQQAGMRWELYK